MSLWLHPGWKLVSYEGTWESTRVIWYVQNWCYTRAEVKMWTSSYIKFFGVPREIPFDTLRLWIHALSVQYTDDDEAKVAFINIGLDECVPKILQSATISLKEQIDLASPTYKKTWSDGHRLVNYVEKKQQRAYDRDWGDSTHSSSRTHKEWFLKKDYTYRQIIGVKENASSSTRSYLWFSTSEGVHKSSKTISTCLALIRD